jgi:inosine-uridine nucleoside N-ribohydrolase
MRRIGTLGRLGALGAVAALAAACGAPNATDAPAVTGEPPTTRLPVIVDTDLDMSDVGALAVLVHDPRVEVRAVTITPAGTGVTDCASGRRVALVVLEALGSATIPIGCGRADPGADGHPFPEEWRSDADRGWGMATLPIPQSRTETAVDLLARAVDESPSAPTIVALGPWTNLEDALAADPTIADRIAGIHAMAGAVDAPGNVVVEGVTAGDGLEWNVAADPSALVAVFDTTTPISLVTLDATNEVPIDPALAERLATDRAMAGADLVYELLVRAPERLAEGQFLWDELAALTLSDPDLATWEETNLLAEGTGRLVRDDAGHPVRFTTGADGTATETALLEALRRGPAPAEPFALSGEVTVAWDGRTCAMKPFEELRSGVAQVTFENTSGRPAGLLMAGVRPPHRWDELVAFLGGTELGTASPPGWVIEGISLNDETGVGSPVRGTMAVEATTYGPVCVTGTWPDLDFRAGDSFDVAGPPAG